MSVIIIIIKKSVQIISLFSGNGSSPVHFFWTEGNSIDHNAFFFRQD